MGMRWTGAPDGRARSRRHYVWAAAAVALTAAGVLGSVLLADAAARDEVHHANEDFATSSRHLASTLELAIQHDDDLVVDAGGLLSDPSLSQTPFERWAASARIYDRYPELKGLAVMEVVDDAELAAFAAQVVADPTGPLAADGTFEVVPAGTRPFYCLIKAAVPTRP